MGDRLLHVGIVTHPAFRGRGYGTAVVSAMTADGLADGRVVQYRTLQANLPSVAVARKARLPALRPYPRRPAHHDVSDGRWHGHLSASRTRRTVLAQTNRANVG